MTGLEIMGKFTERVQSDNIPGPLRRRFTPDRWNREFAAAVTPDEQDKHVHEAGLAIHLKLENIRSCLKLSLSTELSATTKLRALIAGANHNFIVTRNKTHDMFDEILARRSTSDLEGFRPEQLVAETKLNLPGGSKWSPDEIIESIVDGIEVPVGFALRDNPNLAGNPRMNQVAWEDIALELNLGIMFRHAEDLWNECLWNGYKIVEKDKMKIFLPQDLDVSKGYVVGHARRRSLATGYQVMATMIHRSLVADGVLPRLRDVEAIQQNGRKQVLKIAKTGIQTEAQEDLTILRGYAHEPYYTELLEEALPSIGGLTLSSVLDAWTIISRASLFLVEDLSEKDKDSTPGGPACTWLPEYAPILQIDALVQALSLAAGIKPVDGKRLIEFFTFRGAPGQEIWASPLVPVGVKTVAPVFAAVVSPNLRRLVDVWMRQLNIDLGRRGPAFEVHLRASVVDSIGHSAVLKEHAICINEDYTFRPTSGCKEQIDLLFVIGSVVFLGETKCILEPTDAKGVAMHRNTVMGAAQQASRKSRALAENREDFVKDVYRFGIKLPLDFSIINFVVVSSTTHVGIPADNVPVIDKYILERFLIGGLDDVAVKGPDLQIQRKIKTTFYTDVADAQVKAQPYFNQPPQVKPLIDGVVKRFIPIHPITEQDWCGGVVTLACEPSYEDLTI